MKPVYAETSQGKPFGHSSSRAEQRVKYFKFYSEAKLFLKFSWQPVMRRFDVCFKNLAQTDKPGARNPNKQCEKPSAIPGRFIPSLWPEHGGAPIQAASVLPRCRLRKTKLLRAAA
ncbi:hypothetical protein EYF80_015591 [Liparis tanakae]|uniref:Uncharacterized protein n=1 Tax=Liparis tanakae TaxID=230148 RepID=A0A4Z2I7X0_9TELE|nr:hypothetical protein EYF80_015591 [Liparis tanakae]